MERPFYFCWSAASEKNVGRLIRHLNNLQNKSFHRFAYCRRKFVESTSMRQNKPQTTITRTNLFYRTYPKTMLTQLMGAFALSYVPYFEGFWDSIGRSHELQYSNYFGKFNLVAGSCGRCCHLSRSI